MEKQGRPDGRRPIQEYIGARNARFAIFPGSALAKKQPQWVMSAELVETSRLWARVNAKIEPDWVEPLAQHLVKRTYSEPHWEKNQGAVMASRRSPCTACRSWSQRKVNYGRIDPELSRELFIRHALVEGDWDSHHRSSRTTGSCSRRSRSWRTGPAAATSWSTTRRCSTSTTSGVPADVVSARHFDSWWKKARHDQPDLLTFSTDDAGQRGRGRSAPATTPTPGGSSASG